MGRPRVKLEGTRVGRDGHIDVLRVAECRNDQYYYDVRCRLCGREWRTKGKELRRGRACKCIAWKPDAVQKMAEAQRKANVLWLAVTADEYELPVAVADTPEELGAMLKRSPNTIRSMVCRGYKFEGKARHNGSSYTIRFYRVEEADE